MCRMFASIIFALSAACGPGWSPSPDATPSAAPAEGRVEPDTTAALTDRVWLRADTAAPGAIQVFLGNGTLISDSCFETYRLSQWRREQDGAIAWSEDGAEIRATVVRVDDDELALRLELPSGAQEQRFRAATIPYVCPDMPR